MHGYPTEDGILVFVRDVTQDRLALLQLKQSALGADQVEQPFAVIPDIASCALRGLYKVIDLGLAEIKVLGGAEPDQDSLILSANILLSGEVALPVHPNDRFNDGNANVLRQLKYLLLLSSS